jgi:hypothetical protein
MTPLNAACVAVLNHAILLCRLAHREGEMTSEQTEDLMNAIHNIPPMLMRPGYLSHAEIRARLESYDRKWGAGTKSWPGAEGLCAIFDSALKKESERAGGCRNLVSGGR